MIATCCLAREGERLYELEKQCDPCAPALREKLLLITGWLWAIKGYVYETDETGKEVVRCLTYLQVEGIVQKVKNELGFCSNLSDLPDTKLECCENEEKILIEVDFNCDGDQPTIYGKFYIVNGSGSYAIISFDPETSLSTGGALLPTNITNGIYETTVNVNPATLISTVNAIVYDLVTGVYSNMVTVTQYGCVHQVVQK